MILKRSKKSTSKQSSDRGSLVLLWVFITLCFTFGFILANYKVWNNFNFILEGIGLLFIVIGLIIRWTSIFQLNKAFTVDVAIGHEQKLKTDGVYKSVRHPSYLGLFLIMIGFSIGMNSYLSMLVIIIPMFLVIQYRIFVEEKALVDAFGVDYISYRQKTKKLIPWIY